MTEGSATVRYTSGWPISWSDSGVPQRGQYGLIRKSRTSRPLVVNLPQRPPHRLDVAGVHRAVGLRQVDPVAHSLGELGKRIDMAQHRLPAAGIEGRYAICLDIALRGEAELFLYRDLDRQPVAVPAGPPRHVKSLHGLEPREGVLEHPGLDVVHAGHAVRCRRTFVENPGRAASGLLKRALEDLALAPAAQHLVLESGQVSAGGQRGIGARHGGHTISDGPAGRAASRPPAKAA